MSIHTGGRGPGHMARASSEAQHGIQTFDMLSGALDSLITFTRASSGTYFDSAGVMQTATTDVPRFNYEYNGSAWVAKGLRIEPAATNLITYSEQLDDAAWAKTGVTVSANATTAPDGTTTADKIVEVASAATPRIVRGTVTIVSATAYTFSIFAKSAERTQIRLVTEGSASFSAYFDLSSGTVGGVGGSATASIEPYANGWYRCILKWTSGSTNANPYIATAAAGAVIASGDNTKGVYLWGAQIEAGSVATSFIETTSATATRAADVAVVSGTNFSSWFNPTEGTFVAECDTAAASANNRIFSASDALNTSRIFSAANDTLSLYVDVAGAVQTAIVTSVPAANTTFKRAAAYKLNDFAVSHNGGAAVTYTSGALPTVDRLWVGTQSNITQINGHIRRLTYYPVRLSAAQLVALSTL